MSKFMFHAFRVCLCHVGLNVNRVSWYSSEGSLWVDSDVDAKRRSTPLHSTLMSRHCTALTSSCSIATGDSVFVKLSR